MTEAPHALICSLLPTVTPPIATLLPAEAIDSSAPGFAATGPMAPALIIALAVVAALATWLLLPGRRERTIGRIGGAVLLAVALVFAALVARWTINLGGMSVYFWLFSAIALFGSIRVITHDKPVYSALYFVLTVFATAGLFVLMWAEFMAAALVLIYAGAILITYVFVIMLASEATTGGVGSEADARVGDYNRISRSPLAAALVGYAVAGLLIFVIFDKSHSLPTPVNRAGDEYASFAVQNDDVLLKKNGENPGLSTDITSPPGTAYRPAPDMGEADEWSAPATITLANLGSAPALGQELFTKDAVNLQIAAVILTVAMVGAITLARRRTAIPVGGPAEVMTTPGTPVDDNPHSIPVYGTTNPRHKEYPEN